MAGDERWVRVSAVIAAELERTRHISVAQAAEDAASLRAEHEALVKIAAVLCEVSEWRGSRDSWLAANERACEAFHAETGWLAPGKDRAAELGGEPVERYEERRVAWREWTERKNAELDARIATALAAKAGGGT